MKHIFTLIGLIFIASSCVKNNPDPVWLEINEWQLESNPLGNPSGVLTHNITDAWVYIGNEFVGVFEVPCRVPVLYSGEKKVRVYPAIWNNGISSTKKIYPFLQAMEITTNFMENETVTIDPVTSYLSTTEFWIEDFENVGNKFEDDPTSLTSLTTSNDPAVLDPAINGNAFARINLDETEYLWLAYSKGGGDVLELPRGSDVYLEVDYHNTNRVTTGLLAVSPSGTVDNPNIQMNPQEESEVRWKKIYIELREIIGGSDPSAQFRLSFRALLDDEETNGEVNIDNIKVVHF
ncbi:MAG: hypothetical protein HWE22_11265 [Flavobacteriales bacterium]|nr:hypothetical protein [Flavobacteriales bacterium]